MPTQQQLDLLLIREEQARRRARKEFRYFIKLAWKIVEPGSPLQNEFYIDAIADHMQAVAEGKIRNLLINIPPRHGKSTIASVLWPCWLWLSQPQTKLIFTSYAQSLSTRDSIKCRRLITSEWYQSFFQPTWKLTDDGGNKQDEFTNTETGMRMAVSMLGSVMGKGGHHLVCDDPHKRQTIYGVEREKTLESWDESFSSRSIDPKTFTKTIIMQRLHEKDLSGHVLERGGYVHLLLPLEYEPKRAITTALGWSDPRKEPGELLSPSRFGPDEVAAAKLENGEIGYAGQYQQRPAPPEGALAKRSKFRYYKPSELPWDVQQQTSMFDFAATDKNTSDYTAGLFGCRKGGAIYLVDMFHKKLEFPEALQAYRAMHAKHPKYQRRIIENKSAGTQVIQVLQREMTGVIPTNPTESKLVRFMSVLPMIDSESVHLPEGSPWTETFLEEVCGYSGPGTTEHDDVVDCLSGLLTAFQQQGPTFAPTSVSTPGGGSGPRRGY